MTCAIRYKIRNGICFVNMQGSVDTTIGTVTVTTELPKPSPSGYYQVWQITGDNNSNYNYRGVIYCSTGTNEFKSHLFYTGTIYTNFCYPVD